MLDRAPGGLVMAKVNSQRPVKASHRSRPLFWPRRANARGKDVTPKLQVVLHS